MTNTQRYETILFDLDGVLADTKDWVFHAFYHNSQRYGLGVTDAILYPLIGRPLEECYELLAPGHDVMFLTDQHRAFQHEHMDLIKPVPGVLEVLEYLKSSGAKLAIVTGRRHKSALYTMRILDLLDYFPEVVGGDDTERPKPNPDPALRALCLLNAEASSALMVGDAPSDIRCGKSAGCDTCAALYGFVGEKLLEENPTYSIQNIRDMLEIVSTNLDDLICCSRASSATKEHQQCQPCKAKS